MMFEKVVILFSAKDSRNIIFITSSCPVSLKFLKNPNFFSLAEIPKKMKNSKEIAKHALIISHQFLFSIFLAILKIFKCF